MNYMRQLYILIALTAMLIVPETARAASQGNDEGINFVQILMEQPAAGEILDGLDRWRLERQDGRDDAVAFAVLVNLVEQLQRDETPATLPGAIPASDIADRMACIRALVDAFYLFSTPELENLIEDALSSDHSAQRRAGLLAAPTAPDAPVIRSRLLELAQMESNPDERAEAVLGLLALGEGRARDTLEALRIPENASPSLRNAKRMAAHRLAMTLGEWSVPSIDPQTPTLTTLGLDLNLAAGFNLPRTSTSDADPAVITWQAGAFTPDLAGTFSRTLQSGGTIVVVNPRASNWHADFVEWAAASGITLPGTPETSRGPGRVDYADYRPFCDFPYDLLEEEGNAAAHAWRRWGADQAAPIRSISGQGALIVLQEEALGGGRILFSTIALDNKHVYRQNVLRWLYGDALLARPAGYLIPRYGMDPERTTPHRTWAPEWAAGAPRVFWISDETWKRGLIETRQRVAMQWQFAPYDAFAASATAWAGAGSTGRGATGPALMGQRAAALLENELETLDAVVMDTGTVNLLWGRSLTHSQESVMNFDTLPRGLQRRLLRRVHEGMGLLVMQQRHGLHHGGDPDSLSELSRFLRFTHPFISQADMKARLAVAQRGRGRIITSATDFPHLKSLGAHRPPELPKPLRAAGVLRDRFLVDHADYTYAILGKTILWAAGKHTAASIDDLSIADVESDTMLSLRIRLSEPFRGTLNILLRNRYNETIALDPVAVNGQEARTELPRSLPEGAYVLELSFLDESGRTANYAAAWRADDAVPLIAAVDRGADFHAPGEIIRLDLELSAPFDGEAELAVHDTHGRLVYGENLPVTPDATAIAFEIPVEQPLTRLWEAEIVLRRDNRIVARALHPLGIALPPPAVDFDTEAVLPAAPLIDDFRERMAVNLVIGDPEIGLRHHFDFSAGSWWKSIGSLTTPGAVPEPNLRVPCFSDPAFRVRAVRDLHRHGPLFAALGIDNYMMGDEVGLGTPCFCPHSMERFQARLRQEYASLEDLNREWRTDFSHWRDVRPMQGDDPRFPGSHVDYRRFQIWEFSEYCNLLEVTGGDYVPGFTAGHSGGRSDNTLLELSGWLTYYGVQEHVPAVMRRRERRMIGSWFRPGYAFREDHEAQCRHWPWWHLLRGTTRMNLWYTAPGGSPAIHGDLRPYQAYLWLGEEMRAIRGAGLGKLLRGSERDEGRVAVYHSERNGFVRGAVQSLDGPSWTCRHNPAYAFLARQIECRPISEFQVERGEIERRGTALLLLPSIVSLSGRERAALRDFVRQGGVLAADFAPGLRNEHGTWVGDAFARELFGIAVSEEGAAKFETETVRWNHGIDPTPFGAMRTLPEWSVQCAGRGVAPADATPLARVGDDLPALMVHRYGDGWTVLFNLPFPDDPNDPVTHAFIDDLAAMAGVTPFAALESADHSLPTINFGVFRDREAFYAGIVAQGDGGLIEQETSREVVAIFPEQRHLYDSRRGVYLGETDRASWTFTPGKAMLFAGLPGPIRDLRITPHPPQGRRGESFELRVETVADDPVSWRQILRLEARRPDGAHEPAYAGTYEVERGATVIRLPLALDAPAGDWQFTLRDAATGVEGTCTIEVIP